MIEHRCGRFNGEICICEASPEWCALMDWCGAH